MTIYYDNGHAALYVDTENLRDADHAQQVVAQVVANWPDGCPPLAGLSLYVRADKEALWQLWAEAVYPQLWLRVRGVQHFSNNNAKNSADLAITADAVADLMTGQAAAVAVVSNDSDFGALFVKVRELAHASGIKDTPFLWITVPDAGSLSTEMERFIPERLRWDLSAAVAPTAPATSVPTVSRPDAPSLPERPRPAALPAAPAPADAGSDNSNEAVAEELIRQLPVGRFKVSDAQKVIQRRWSRLPNVAVGDTAQLGTFLLNSIWPELQKRGVTMPRKSSPRTYEMTPAAKSSLTAPSASPREPPPDAAEIDGPAPVLPAQPPPAESTAAEPPAAGLAAAVADGIADDIFKASDAQVALKAHFPRHPAASYTAQRFGTWFAEQLWPVMERSGVVLANEKPRRYEMTPDARQRLIALAA